MGRSLYDYCLEREDFLLLVQWDKAKNGSLTPHDVSHASHKKVWWTCAQGHSWQAQVYARTGAGTGCPYCTGRKIPPEALRLSEAAPAIAAQWHPTKNGSLTPDALSPKSQRKVWWVCDQGHEWQATVKSRTAGSGCPYCTNRRVLPGENDLASKYPAIAAQWHPTQNGTLGPEDVLPGSSRRVWWICEKGHEWQARINARIAGNGCPVCKGKTVIEGQNDLAGLYPKLAVQWHPTKNGSLTPAGVTPYSNRKAWWICEKGHTYQAIIASRTQGGTGCPYCDGKKVLAGYNDLASSYPELAAQWHPEYNGGLTPEMVTAGSHKKVWWRCAEGHVWMAVVFSRTGKRQHGCPICAGKVPARRLERYAEILGEAALRDREE